MGLGKHNRINYIGLTRSPSSRFHNHPKIEEEGNIRFYVGVIVSQGVSGKRSKKTRPDLDICEHVLIATLKPELNTHRKKQNFSDCVSIFSRFFEPYEDADGDWRSTQKLAKFPEFIGYNSWSESLKVLK